MDEDQWREAAGWAIAAVVWTVAERATVWAMDAILERIRSADADRDTAEPGGHEQ